MSKRKKSPDSRAFDIAVGRRIELTRNALNVAAVDLARVLAVSAMTVYRYESGQTSCPPEKIAKIAAFMGVSVSALIPKPHILLSPENCAAESR